MKIERVWAMPSKWTFTIKPIKKLLQQEMDGGVWLDPMAGYNSPAHITNDINPDTPAQHHLDALDFLKQQDDESVDGVLFDPPYSFILAKTHYNTTLTNYIEFTQLLNRTKWHLARILKPHGKAISFGYDSNGLGKHPYMMEEKSLPTLFEIYRILLVAHGWKRDTIVTCQRKVQTTL